MFQLNTKRFYMYCIIIMFSCLNIGEMTLNKVYNWNITWNISLS